MLEMVQADALAKRWHCAPWEVEQAEQRWRSYGAGVLDMEYRINQDRPAQ